MGFECKVCNSDKRDFIESLILQGHSNLAVSTTVKDMGEDISHASINRHKTKHMADYAETIKEVAHEKGNRKYDREDSQNSFVINASVIYEEIERQALHTVNYTETAKNNAMMQIMLSKIVNNQLAITIDLQEKYMKGEVKYPNEQVRGLQIVHEIMIKLDSYTRQNFKHYEKLMNSENGISDHIFEQGKNAKKELELKTPYVKGSIFINMIDDEDITDYYNDYCPVNPYAYPDLLNTGNCEYTFFESGAKSERSNAEKFDYRIYELLGHKAIDIKLYEKLVKKYSENDYVALNEMRKLEKIIAAYEENDE